MRDAKLCDMTRGWFLGDFSPSVLRRSDFEVAVQSFRAGTFQKAHHHKIAVEITVIVSGHAEMFGRQWVGGDIIVIEPGEETSFRAITDVVTVVVKIPSVSDDKYSAVSAPEPI